MRFSNLKMGIWRDLSIWSRYISWSYYHYYPFWLVLSIDDDPNPNLWGKKQPFPVRGYGWAERGFDHIWSTRHGGETWVITGYPQWSSILDRDFPWNKASSYLGSPIFIHFQGKPHLGIPWSSMASTINLWEAPIFRDTSNSWSLCDQNMMILVNQCQKASMPLENVCVGDHLDPLV